MPTRIVSEIGCRNRPGPATSFYILVLVFVSPSAFLFFKFGQICFLFFQFLFIWGCLCRARPGHAPHLYVFILACWLACRAGPGTRFRKQFWLASKPFISQSVLLSRWSVFNFGWSPADPASQPTCPNTKAKKRSVAGTGPASTLAELKVKLAGCKARLAGFRARPVPGTPPKPSH